MFERQFIHNERKFSEIILLNCIRCSVIPLIAFLALAGLTRAEDDRGTIKPTEQIEQSLLEGYETTFPAMGSTMSIIAYSESEGEATKAFADARAEVTRLNAIMTDYESDSELNLFLLKAAQPTPVSPDLWRILSASQHWYEISGGAFDASVGSLTQLWRAARRAKSAPSPVALEKARECSGWQYVHLDQKTKTASISNPNVKIDLGGIAAGYIIDATFDVMKNHRLNKCLINAGGDIRCGDPPPGRKGWRIEVAPIAAGSQSKTATSSHRTSQPLRRIYLSNASIVTSGDLWQFSQFDGVRRSHIIDPKTGLGVPGPSVVAVIAKNCLDADAAATAISVMGLERGMLFASEKDNLEAMMVVREQNLDQLEYRITKGFPAGIFEP